MNSVLKLRVCHFSYFTLVSEGALIIFFPRKKRQGALIGAGALNGANTVFLIKTICYDPSYVMTPHLNCLIETVQMRGHNICFYAELTKIISNYHKILPLI